MTKLKHNFIDKVICIVFCAVLLISAVSAPLSIAVNAAQTVKITFTNTLDNSTEEISGEAGSPIAYPADPTDPNGAKWFMGWYTGTNYRTEYTSENFDTEDIVLYSKWVSEFKTITQDFENYTKEQYEEKTNASGEKEKSNRLYFFEGMEKQSDVTYNNSGNAIKVNWDSTMTKKADDANTYNAEGRITQPDVKLWLGTGIENKVPYKITLKYKIDKADTAVSAVVCSALNNNIFSGRVEYGSINLSRSTDEWQTATLNFITNFSTIDFRDMYLVFKITENKDYTLYVDDVVIEPVVLPIQGLVTVYPNNGDSAIYVKGTRGEAITLPEVKNDDIQFLGWFADEDLKVPFTETVFNRKNLTAYAKWSLSSEKFANYPYEFTLRSPFTLSVKEGQNLGYNDNYALNFLFDGDAKFNFNGTEYELATRANNARDNIAKIGDIESGSVYRISYWRKAGKDTVSNFNITLTSGAYPNSWTPGCAYTVYDDTKVNVKANETEWVKESFAIIPSFTNPAENTLYLQFGSNDSSKDSYIDAYVDNVLFEKVEGDIIYFDGSTVGVKDQVISGNAGEAFVAPEITNGRNEFLGWYTDAACTVPFTATTIPEGFTRVYAKWSIAPIGFDEYSYDLNSTQIAGKTINIKNVPNAGYDDDYSLNLRFVGNEIYQINDDGSITYVYSRTFRSHSAKISELQDNSVYKVSYYYRVNKATNDVVLSLFSANRTNLWAGMTEYEITKFKADVTDIGEWKKVSFCISTKFASAEANGFFINFNVQKADENSVVDIDIDNFSIEKVAAPFIYYDYTLAGGYELIEGKVGDKIVPSKTPECFGKVFTGWYLDAECTKPFEEKIFSDNTSAIVYAGWKEATSAICTFESYNLPDRGEIPGVNQRRDARVITSSKALSGKHVLEIDRSEDAGDTSFAAIASDNNVFEINPKYKYVVTVNYYIAKETESNFYLYVGMGNPTNYYAYGVNSDKTKCGRNIKSGMWHTATFVLDGSKITNPLGNGLFLSMQGGADGKFLFDDISVTRVPTGNTVVIIDNGDCKKVPNYVVGRPGASFASKLPTAPTYSGKFFKGYFTLGSDGKYVELKREDMLFDKEKIVTIYARFLDLKVTENFDDGVYRDAADNYAVMTIHDFDFELYNCKDEGNSADNVVNGNYSLHRKGDSHHNESAMILTFKNSIAPDERYTVTFKVKMGKYKHTDGAVKLASCVSDRYGWDTMGDRYAVIAIEDLKDGLWHEVTYTFNSVERYVSIITPGDVELFFDDFVFSLDQNGELSTPVSFTEYVTATQDNTINLDVATIIDLSLSSNVIDTWLIIVIAVVCVLLIGGGAFFIVKSKKAKKQ